MLPHKVLGTFLSMSQGVNGLTKRDIQLVVEGGYNTVESVAYTCVLFDSASCSAHGTIQAKKDTRNDQGHLGAESKQDPHGR